VRVLHSALLGVCLAAHLQSFFPLISLGRLGQIIAASQASPLPLTPLSSDVDVHLWAKARIKAYRSSLALRLPGPIAVLTIPHIRLTAPIFNGTDEETLNRGVGRVPGTAMPGEDGNLAIAGHRDGFFRSLKDIAVGDLIEIKSQFESETYIVNSKEIVSPDDVRVLQAGPINTATLITCYPFYFHGDAPQRFIVRASLIHRDLLQQAASKREIQKTAQ